MLCSQTYVLCSADEIPLSRPKKRKPKGKTPLGKVQQRLKTGFVILGETYTVAKAHDRCTFFSLVLVLNNVLLS